MQACLGGGQTSASSSEASDDIGLLNDTWITVDIRGGEPVSTAGNLPTITFSDEIASGNSSCNGWSADYTIQGSKIQFSNFVVSEITCDPPGVMDQERFFLQLLSEAEGFEVKDGRLTIFDGRGGSIVFKELGS